MTVYLNKKDFHIFDITHDGALLVDVHESVVKFYLRVGSAWILSNTFPYPDDTVKQVCITPGGDCIALLGAQKVEVLRLDSSVVWSMDSVSVKSMAISGDGGRILLGFEDRAQLFKTEDGSQIGNDVIHDCFCVDIAEDGQTLGIGCTTSGMAYVYRVAETAHVLVGEELCFGESDETTGQYLNIRLALSSGGTTVVYSCNSGDGSKLRIKQLDEQTSQWSLLRDEVYSNERDVLVGISNTGNLIVRRSDTGSLVLISLTELPEVQIWTGTNSENYVSMSGNASVVVTTESTYEFTHVTDVVELRNIASAYFAAAFPVGDQAFLIALVERLFSKFFEMEVKYETRVTKRVMDFLTEIKRLSSDQLLKRPAVLAEFMRARYPLLIDSLDVSHPLVNQNVEKYILNLNLSWSDRDINDWSESDIVALKSILKDYVQLSSVNDVVISHYKMGGLNIGVTLVTSQPVTNTAADDLGILFADSSLGAVDNLEIQIIEVVDSGLEVFTPMALGDITQISGSLKSAVLSFNGSVFALSRDKQLEIYQKSTDGLWIRAMAPGRSRRTWWQAVRD